MIGAGLRQRATLALELAANNGLTFTETGASDDAIRLARAAVLAVISCGASSATKLEAAAMLRDGWRPRRVMRLREVQR